MKLTDSDRLDWLESRFFRKDLDLWSVVSYFRNLLDWMRGTTTLREGIDKAILEENTRRISTC
jgi:hypothetical protein